MYEIAEQEGFLTIPFIGHIIRPIVLNEITEVARFFSPQIVKYPGTSIAYGTIGVALPVRHEEIDSESLIKMGNLFTPLFFHISNIEEFRKPDLINVSSDDKMRYFLRSIKECLLDLPSTIDDIVTMVNEGGEWIGRVAGYQEDRFSRAFTLRLWEIVNGK